jgi:alpha-ketoglutarate-dependent 2,4-dichlorophenoxyacetate dioxygenase
MTLSIRPLRNEFAGEVAGIDITRPISREEVAAIEAGMDRYAVLVFHDQHLTDEQQLAFTLNFGELESYQTAGHVRKPDDHRLGPGMADFSNLDKQGNIMSREDRVWFFKLGDRLWHSDSSFCPVTAKYSLLSGRVIPSWGGDTEFADMRSAYDALDDRTKAEIEDLVCEHSLIYSRGSIGFAEMTPEEKENFRPVRHNLVRRDPQTGRKSLFLSSHAGAIVGWTIPEARMLLRDLTEHATQPQFVHRHRWKPNDLVIWDNRTTMHRARRFDRNEVRDVRRTTLAGDALPGDAA